MNKIKKPLALAVLAFVAAGSLLFIKPIRAWASAEGTYLYHQFVLRGPAYIFKSDVGGAQGVIVSTSPYTGASQGGVPTAGAGVSFVFYGAFTTAARPAAAAGLVGYDQTVNSLVFSDGTFWYKAVLSASTDQLTWTAY